MFEAHLQHPQERRAKARLQRDACSARNRGIGIVSGE